jgi:polar amino acid transport system substrate-binding protein
MFRAHLLAGVIALQLAPASFACEVSLAYGDSPSAPFTIGGNLVVPTKPGIAIEIAKAAVTDAGCTVKLTRLPGQRVLRAVEIGDFDGAIMFSHSAQRARAMEYPIRDGTPDSARRLATLRYFLYRRKGDKISWDGATLKNPGGLPIGINYGFSIGELLVKLGSKTEEVKTTEQNLGKLRLGRIAGYAMQEHIADAMILSLHYENEIEKLPMPLLTKDYFLTFSHAFYLAHPELAEKIWILIGEKREPMTHTLLPQYHN